MKRNKLILLFLFLSSICFGQTNYYVSPTGSDLNNGTSIGTPWRTIQHSANSATPNSIVNILSGTYNELVSINVSGTIGNPITFKNYQNDAVIISGIGLTASYSNLIAINSKNNIIIDGLILENLTAAFARGILVLSNVGSGIENISLKNLKIRNIGYTNVVGSNPVAGDNAHGIEVYGQGTASTDAIKNISIENCEIYNNITGYSESVTINGNVDGYSILNNNVHDNTNIGIDVAGNFGASATPALDHARNGIISGNTVYNNVSPVANSSGIYCDGCWDTVIERNTSHHNTVGITVGCEQNGTTDNVTVRDNMVYQNTFTGIEIGGYTTYTTGIVNNAVINNNTCFDNDTTNQHGEMVINKVNNCQLFNNILYSDGNLLFYVDKIDPQSFTSNYNEFYTTAGASNLANVNYRWDTISYDSYKTISGKDLNSIFSNPQFVNSNVASLDFHLQNTSSAINSGDSSYLPTISEKDFDGEIRSANGRIDIGADEFICQTTTWIGTAWTNGVPTASTEAIIAGTYSTASNGVFTANKLTINPDGFLTINSSTNLTVENEVINNAGASNFVIENNANLIQVNNSVNTTPVTIKRNSSPLFRLDYTMWSSPVSGSQVLGGLTGFSPLTSVIPISRFYTYDSDTNVYNTIADPSTTTFGLAKGYLIRMPNNWIAFGAGSATSWTGSFTGIPNNGNLTFAISTDGNGYNAVGNPYPSTLNIDNFIAGNTTNIDGTLWFWRKTNDSNNATSYSTCTTAGCTLNNGHTYPDSNFISIGQGFIVKAKLGQNTLNFTNAMRIANNQNQFFKTKQVERNRIWLNLSNDTSLVNQMMVSYMTGATSGIDDAIDGRYINDSSTALNSLVNNEEFVIQGRGLPFSDTDVVPLTFKTTTAGNFTIVIDHVDGLFSNGQNIFLKDKLTGTVQDVKQSAYTFSSGVGTFNNRFELVYKSGSALGIEESTIDANTVIVYNQKGVLTVDSGKTIMKTVKVFDVRGRLIFEQKDINASSTVLKELRAAQQALIVQIISDENKMVNKKVIY